jgi:hypothetical protein
MVSLDFKTYGAGKFQRYQRLIDDNIRYARTPRRREFFRGEPACDPVIAAD